VNKTDCSPPVIPDLTRDLGAEYQIQFGFIIKPLHYDVQEQCASFNVRLRDGVPHTTESLSVGRLFEHYPDLRRHRCESGRHRSFEVEARQTETVHLLEHLAVELLALSGVPRDKAYGQTGIPRCSPPVIPDFIRDLGARNDIPRQPTQSCSQNADITYHLRFYGADSLEHMDVLLQCAAEIFEDLLLV